MHLEPRRQGTQQLDTDAQPDECGHAAVFHRGRELDLHSTHHSESGGMPDLRAAGAARCPAPTPAPHLHCAGAVIHRNLLLRHHIELLQGVGVLRVGDVADMLQQGGEVGRGDGAAAAGETPRRLRQCSSTSSRTSNTSSASIGSRSELSAVERCTGRRKVARRAWMMGAGFMSSCIHTSRSSSSACRGQGQMRCRRPRPRLQPALGSGGACGWGRWRLYGRQADRRPWPWRAWPAKSAPMDA